MGKLPKKILKILGATVLFLLILIAVILGIFYIRKATIKKRVLNELNSVQAGEIQFRDIFIIPQEFYPYLVLRLDDLQYFEHPADQRLPDEQPIIAGVP